MEGQTMIRYALVLWAIVAMVGALDAGAANSGPAPMGTGAGPPPTEQQALSGRPHDVEKAEDYQDRAHLLSGRNAAKERAAAREQSEKLTAAIQLPCEITDAEPVGRGKAQFEDKKVAVSIYEIACRNGLGYILVSREDGKPYATSCFSADKTHAADLAKGHKSDMYCQLPANKDVKAMAAALMSAAGTTCAVRNLQWFGRSMTTNTEYSEVVCQDGAGYMLRTAQAGATEPTVVMTCPDAAARGLACRLTGGDVSPKPSP
jgi:hypothetical protein